MHVDAAVAVERRDAAVLLEPVGLGRHLDEADRPEPGRQAGLGLEPRVEIARVLAHLGRRLRGRAERHHQPGGVPGGARGQPVALEQHDVPDAHVRQVVGDRGADDAAADDDDPGAVGQDCRLPRGSPGACSRSLAVGRLAEVMLWSPDRG